MRSAIEVEDWGILIVQRGDGWVRNLDATLRRARRIVSRKKQCGMRRCALPSLGRMEDLLLDMFVVACSYADSADSICGDTVGPQLMRGWIWNGVSVGAANRLLLVSHHSDPAGATLSGPSSANVWGEGGP
jgi:hypothetical protein